jgi:hypothetical protein
MSGRKVRAVARALPHRRRAAREHASLRRDTHTGDVALTKRLQVVHSTIHAQINDAQPSVHVAQRNFHLNVSYGEQNSEDEPVGGAERPGLGATWPH